ncbi:signal peptidase II [uncultured Corynebacterium sp.]|uniref:signal peptidase II n=1 Tax=uncultured Corynebacterium sp. TaxID=159447 RepID=UPI0025D3AA8A|nr:signal peptidase II [uncultured Corynebacterium sp.]
MTSKRASFAALTLMFGIIAVDQITKWAVVENLEPQRAYPVIGEFFRLYLVRNPGAAFSMGTNATIVFSIFQLVAFAACIVLALRTRYMAGALPIGLIGGGAAGNLLDRIFREPGGMHGHVVDFLSFGSFAIFNVADAAITVGVVCYLIYAFFVEPANHVREERAEQEEAGEEQEDTSEEVSR